MSESTQTEDLEALLSTEITGLPDGDALLHIAALIDAASDSMSRAGTQRAFALLEEVGERALCGPDAALAHYLRANAWANKHHEQNDPQTWAWEQPETRAQILELRRAMRHEGFGHLPAVRQCQIITNLANQLSTIGRFIEAIALWDRVLRTHGQFAMALGNRGRALSSYAHAVYDHGHAGLMHVAAFDSLQAATAPDAIYESVGFEPARAYFERTRKALASHVNIILIRQAIDVENHSMGRSAAERAYRTWCLEERLFINPLNDLGNLPIAAQDVLTLPSLTDSTQGSAMPAVIGFFNQMRQEFVSARYLFYEGFHSEQPHFSDRHVLLYNTLDYPAYSLAAEKMRAAFRIAYSLFDKIAFFLNSYFNVGRKPAQVSFKNIWYEAKDKQRPLLTQFSASENWPLRGLFWLSKDLFEEDFQSVTEPDAEALLNIRNHAEHRYLQLHESWIGPQTADEREPMRYDLSRDDFARRTLRLLQLVRGALIYLSLAVHREEVRQGQIGSGLSMHMPLDRLKDEWKI